MKKIFSLIGLILLIAFLARLPIVQSQVPTVPGPPHPIEFADDLLKLCNEATAYSTGVSDARKGLARKYDYARICPVNHERVNAQYETGYQYGQANPEGLVIQEPARYHPASPEQPQSHEAPIPPGFQCVYTSHGEICGYHCKHSLDNAECAISPDQNCVANSHGDIACGYHCIASFDKIRCAISPGDNCVTDNRGRIKCGFYCRIVDGELLCAIERYAD